MKYLLIVAVVVLLAAGGYVYSQKGTSTPANNVPAATQQTGDEETEQATITIKNQSFSPKIITVRSGEMVAVTNMDPAGHSVTVDDGTAFDTGILSQGKTKTFKAPTKVGTYTFHCTAHPSMAGTLVVEE